MKYCPYCGAEVINKEVAFCTECGKALPANSEETNSEDILKKQSHGIQKHSGKRDGSAKGVCSKDKISKSDRFAKEQSRAQKKLKEKKCKD